MLLFVLRRRHFHNALEGLAKIHGGIEAALVAYIGNAFFRVRQKRACPPHAHAVYILRNGKPRSALDQPAQILLCDMQPIGYFRNIFDTWRVFVYISHKLYKHKIFSAAILFGIVLFCVI